MSRIWAYCADFGSSPAGAVAPASPPWQLAQPSFTAEETCMVLASEAVWQETQPRLAASASSSVMPSRAAGAST